MNITPTSPQPRTELRKKERYYASSDNSSFAHVPRRNIRTPHRNIPIPSPEYSVSVVQVILLPKFFTGKKEKLLSSQFFIFKNNLGFRDSIDMPYLVRENLFIGNISDAADVLENNEGTSDITYVLSMLSSASISFFSEWRSSLSIPTKEIQRVFAVDSEFCDGPKSALSPEKLVYNLEYAGKGLKIVRMAVPIKDTEDENLLDYLEVCLDFIEESRKQGSVLVHCFAGVSRSAAIVTAYLMRSEQLCLEVALESLRQGCEFVSPNDNFLEQLKMFEKMGFKVDRGSTIYKRFRLKILGDSYNRGEKLDSSKFGADPGLQQKVALPQPETSPDGNLNVAYRCKKCRRVVALQENVVDHKPGEGMSAFQWHKRSSGNPFNVSEDLGCSSIFVEPLKWMKTVEEGALEGKLSCAHCDGRLGYFNWSGIQCNCGSWITPAFQLHKGRMDLSTV